MKIVDDNGIELGEISKIKLDPNDVIVLDFGKAEEPTQEALYNMSRNLHEIFPKNKVMFLSGNIELKIIDGGSDNEQRD